MEKVCSPLVGRSFIMDRNQLSLDCGSLAVGSMEKAATSETTRNYKLSAIICANYFYFFLRAVGNLRKANPRRSRNRP